MALDDEPQSIANERRSASRSDKRISSPLNTDLFSRAMDAISQGKSATPPLSSSQPIARQNFFPSGAKAMPGRSSQTRNK
jgi:hypothetical protein